MLFPTSCPICGAIGAAPCARCARRVQRPPVMPRPSHLSSLSTYGEFDGVLRDLVLSLKYANRRDALAWMAAELAAVAPAGVDVVVPVPTTARRRGTRGFDQAAVLARRVGRELEVPMRRLLRRVGDGHQTGRSAAERRRGPDFRAQPTGGACVLLLDDVVTTGATMSSAAKALRLAGAGEVHGIALAGTPRPSRHRTGALKSLANRPTW